MDLSLRAGRRAKRRQRRQLADARLPSKDPSPAGGEFAEKLWEHKCCEGPLFLSLSLSYTHPLFFPRHLHKQERKESHFSTPKVGLGATGVRTGSWLRPLYTDTPGISALSTSGLLTSIPERTQGKKKKLRSFFVNKFFQDG